MSEQHAQIERVGPVIVDRTTGVVECRLSEMPDAAWRRAVREYEARLPFFHTLSLAVTSLKATLVDPMLSLDLITTAIDARIRHANTTRYL
jgi:hypothetical protein